jgi:sulfonate transport system substrate-binding protein
MTIWPISRIRTLFILLLIFSVQQKAAFGEQLLIGDQKGNMRAVLEASGALKGVPYDIQWSEFVNAAPMFEALSSGALDVISAGDAPLAFAAAQGVKAKAIFASRYEGTGIIVSGNSPIFCIADLAGKRIAVVRGSSGHGLLLQALRNARLTPDDVQLVFLPPSEATLALENGSVDAAATWEPNISFARLRLNARLIADGKDYPILSYAVASDDAIREKQHVLRDFVCRLSKAREWGMKHESAYASYVANLVRLPADVALSKLKREKNIPVTFDPATLNIQQSTIDTFAAAGLIKVNLRAEGLVHNLFSSGENVESGCNII